MRGSLCGIFRQLSACDIEVTPMKDDVHPKYYDNAEVICGCGNKFTTGSTQAKIAVEICSACHPFFTGAQKFVDTAGRVEKFQKKFGGNYFKTAKKPATKA